MKVAGYAILLGIVAMCCVLLIGCGTKGNVGGPAGPQAISGIHEVKPEVKTGADGLTNEQRNIRDRLKMDSVPGSIKHLYVMSVYSGDILIYSTVRGKVTSSGKRLSPTQVACGHNRDINGSGYAYGIPVTIGGRQQHTGEVLQDDGTYGSSIDYLYWYDSKGSYHQHYLSGGQLLHISDQPLAVKKVILNLEERRGE